MPQFRRKPIVVEAVRFIKADALARTEGTRFDMETTVSFVNGQPALLTTDGLAGVADGDWILTYDDGRQEVWRPSSFTAQWEQVTG